MLPRCRLVAVSARGEDGGLIVEIVWSLGVPVRDEDVFAPVVVEVGQQGAPAPIRRGGAREIRDLAEYDVAARRHAVAELQRVGVVVVAIATAPLLHASGVREIAAQDRK